MNSFSRVVSNLRSKLQSIRSNASSAAHSSSPKSKQSLYDKYWNDGLPLFPERIIYRNNYAEGYKIPAKKRALSECIAGTFWCWIFWHLWHEPEHVFGHYFTPEPSEWTDAELGIPPDDVE